MGTVSGRGTAQELASFLLLDKFKWFVATPFSPLENVDEPFKVAEVARDFDRVPWEVQQAARRDLPRSISEINRTRRSCMWPGCSCSCEQDQPNDSLGLRAGLPMAICATRGPVLRAVTGLTGRDVPMRPTWNDMYAPKPEPSFAASPTEIASAMIHLQAQFNEVESCDPEISVLNDVEVLASRAQLLPPTLGLRRFHAERARGLERRTARHAHLT